MRGDWIVKVMTWCSRSVGADAWEPGYFPGAHSSWSLHILCNSDSEVTHFFGGGGLAPAHRQWRKLVETEQESQVDKWACAAAHTTAHSRQPPPPTDFSLQFKDDV